MITEIKTKNRTAKLELVHRDGNNLTVNIDGKPLELDMVKVSPGIYSVLLNGKSYNIELLETGNGRRFTVNTFYNSYDVEIIDSQARYRNNRRKLAGDSGSKNIVSPMPGKVVKILAREGDMVEAGQTVIIISAMKMESEFKAASGGKVSKIYVNEGDTVEGNKTLIVIE